MPTPKRQKFASGIDRHEATFAVSKEEKARRAAEAKLPPRSWMLRKGWQRHGLIGVMEAPKEGQRPVRRSARLAALVTHSLQ